MTMAGTRVEVLVEPFRENDPGPYVLAAVDAMSSAGLDPDMGPFATTGHGEAETVIGSIPEILQAAFGAGANAVQIRVEQVDP